jgi:hypothetical protein
MFRQLMDVILRIPAFLLYVDLDITYYFMCRLGFAYFYVLCGHCGSILGYIGTKYILAIKN